MIISATKTGNEPIDEERCWFPPNTAVIELTTPIHVLEALQALLGYYVHGKVPYDFAISHALHGLQSYDTDIRSGKLAAVQQWEERIARLLVELRPHLAADDNKLASELLKYGNARRAIATVH